jgi:hypothetical protein
MLEYPFLTIQTMSLPPDNNLSTPPPPGALQEAWFEPQPGYLFDQLANQSTDNDDESIQDVTYEVYNLEEDDAEQS